MQDSLPENRQRRGRRAQPPAAAGTLLAPVGGRLALLSEGEIDRIHDAALAILQSELDAPLEEVFSSICTEPVAAASLGQVYRATLRRGGVAVAVRATTLGFPSLALTRPSSR